jgi:hypothetical protein
LSRFFQHSWREIQTEDRCASVVQIAGDVTGAAAHVTNLATSCDFSGEAIEQFAVKGLVLKFIGNPAGILVRNPVIALAD